MRQFQLAANPALLLLLLIAWSAASSSSSSSSSSNNSQAASQNSTDGGRLLSRMKRNKFVKKFLEKSKASQDKVSELKSQSGSDSWPVIAWKSNSDIFSIGDDGQVESSPFEAVIEVIDTAELQAEDREDQPLTDFSLQPAMSYKNKVAEVRARISVYNKAFLVICCLLCVSNFVMIFIHYWVVGLARAVLRAGLKLEFPGRDGPTRQEFIYALAYAVEDDLMENPASEAEQGFAACINDIVVAVESYTKNR